MARPDFCKKSRYVSLENRALLRRATVARSITVFTFPFPVYAALLPSISQLVSKAAHTKWRCIKRHITGWLNGVD